MRARFVAAILAMVSMAGHAHAGQGGDIARHALETGAWAEGEAKLADAIKADPKDGEAVMGLGLVRLAEALERFGQHQYRYGLTPVPSVSIPFFRLPVPVNPHPDLLTYEAQRAALARLLDDLAAVDAALAPLGDTDAKLVVDLEKVRLDFATADPRQATTLMDVVRALRAGRAVPVEGPAAFEVAFDRGDALWLRGYTHLLSAGLEFLLAYDWHETFELSAGFFYPRLRTMPDQGARASNGFGDEREIADLVALVHAIRWPLADAARLPKVRAHLAQVVALSRASWTAILAETDDDREWLPAPKQKNGVLAGVAVTQDRLDAWFRVLDDVEAVLDGRKLIPHWRFAKGIDLRQVFEAPRPFDLVLWISGSAATPYLRDGDILTSEEWQLLQNAFEGDLLTYAAYFN